MVLSSQIWSYLWRWFTVMLYFWMSHGFAVVRYKGHEVHLTVIWVHICAYCIHIRSKRTVDSLHNPNHQYNFQWYQNLKETYENMNFTWNTEFSNFSSFLESMVLHDMLYDMARNVNYLVSVETIRLHNCVLMSLRSGDGGLGLYVSIIWKVANVKQISRTN